MEINNKTIGRLMVGCLLAGCAVLNINAQGLPGGIGGGGGGGNASPNPPPDISNYLKYQAQAFLVLDTNAVVATDPNLFNTLASFSANTGTNPVLQVMPYSGNCLLFKASHFDYSGEATRDFCLAVCDKVETPLYKNMDLSNPSNNIQNGGWLVQGSVPTWKLTDPMFLMVSNTSRSYNGFFRVIPYGGPEISAAGPQAYDVVSNTIAIQAVITDLSGVTNSSFDVTVDGLPARYSIGTSNTINLNTKYNPNGAANVYFTAQNNARVYDPSNTFINTKLFFSGSTTLPLDFENDTYLAFASDYCPTNLGTNYIYFVIDKAQDIEATIFKPSNGQTVAHYSGHVPYPTTIAIPWNFTEADHVTPYSNDTYAVTFTAFDPTTITITNNIDRFGVRPGAGCFLTYQEQDAFGADGGDFNNYLNQQADTWISQTLKQFFTDLYKNLSLTQYTPGQVGANRNHCACQPLDSSHVSWEDILKPALSNSIYSDFTVAQAHGSGATIGGGGYLLSKFTTQDLYGWLLNYQPRANWRLRKAALWTCYSGDLTATGQYPSFPVACGIRDDPKQANSFMRKNCGLFFGGELPQNGFGDNGSVVTAKVAEALDQTWVCGENQYPGGCDPTYSFAWAVNATRGVFNPEMDYGDPRLFGLPQMIYSSLYDDDLAGLDFSNVKHPNGF